MINDLFRACGLKKLVALGLVSWVIRYNDESINHLNMSKSININVNKLSYLKKVGEGE